MIIRGAIPVLPYIFWINAIPRMAALLSVRRLNKLSLDGFVFTKEEKKSATKIILSSVAIKQKRTNLPFQALF